VEATVSARVLRHRAETGLLDRLGRAMPYLIVTYLLVRVSDMIGRGVVLEALRGFWPAVWWWLEIGLLLTAVALFATPEFRRRPVGLPLAAWATVLGLVVHGREWPWWDSTCAEYPRYVRTSPKC
jgi:hypothetical protein